jgi:FkbM family methyltransferase
MELSMSTNLFSLLSNLELPLPRGILQVGASYGQELEDFIGHGIKKALLIEALPEPFEHISQICQKTPGYIAFNGLCSEASGIEHVFHIASNGGQSSSILKPIKHLEIFDFVKFEEEIRLRSTTVDDIIQFLIQNNYSSITDDLDTLYMDVQGAEFKVLLGSPRTLKQINYIYTEFIRGNLYQDTLPIESYCALLDAHGFTLNNLNFNKFHHADVLFIRKDLLSL